MPIYEYKCIHCSQITERLQKESKVYDTCATCGGPARFKPSVTGFRTDHTIINSEE